MSDRKGSPSSTLRNRDVSKSGKSAKNGSSAVRGEGAKVKATGGGMGRRRSWIWFPVLLFIGISYWLITREDPSVPKHSVNWWDENVHLPLGFQKRTYAVIIDAGSTGSRVLAFAFHQNLKGKIFLKAVESTLFLLVACSSFSRKN